MKRSILESSSNRRLWWRTHCEIVEEQGSGGDRGWMCWRAGPLILAARVSHIIGDNSPHLKATEMSSLKPGTVRVGKASEGCAPLCSDL